MSMNFKNLLLVLFTILLGAVSSSAQADTNYNFNFTGSAGDTVIGIFTVNGSSITDITGNVNYSGTNYSITGIASPYGEQNNWLGAPQYLDTTGSFDLMCMCSTGGGSGVSFSTNNGGGVMNLTYHGSGSTYTLNPYNLPGSANGTLTVGAPEIDGSLAPKVGFLLGCLFLMFGRKKQNFEPMMTA